MTHKGNTRKHNALNRVFGLFVKRLETRAAAAAVLLILLVLAAVILTVRRGADISWISGSQSTDDAYIRADQIAISSHIAGYVVAIPVQDNQWVRKGQLLAQIEDDDYRASLANALAECAAAQAAVTILSDQVLVQQQGVAAARAISEQAGLEYIRQRNLIGGGTTSHRELEAAHAAMDAASAALTGAIRGLQVIEDQGIAARDNLQAKTAMRDLAQIALGYT